MIEKLKQLIGDSATVFITSHISPDPDALSSLLLLGTALELNYPDKTVIMSLEEPPEDLEFLEGYERINFGPVYEKLAAVKPNLFIMVDGSNYERCSRHDGDKIRQYLHQNGIKAAIIDHHEPAGRDEVDIYLNQKSPSTAQDVYEICFKRMSLKRPAGAAQTAMTGLYADSGGFAYLGPHHSRTFILADELVSEGADIEEIKNILTNYNQADLSVISELAANATGQDDYSYSFISDEFIDDWLKHGKTAEQLHKATETFVNDYIRNIDGRKWGFITYKNILQGDNMYSVSLRALGDVKDVSKIAASLGGGGHKPAAGAKFAAGSVQEAIAKVKSVIES